MNQNPIKIGLIFLGAACTSLGFGVPLLYLAWVGFRDASYPLTHTVQLRGIPARIAACVIGAFGTIVVICGIATLVFGIFRVKQLL
ncbi:MAG: hypothetical protein JNL58_04175 [Planctomyces sp.]|nr:hypothetical protein [Planctomyces sp.]